MIKGKNQQEIERIQNKVFGKYGKKVLREEITDNTDLYEAAIKDKNISKEAKEKLKKARDNGAFYSKETVEDEKTAKKMDAMMNHEIEKAFKDGRLTPEVDAYAKKHGYR